MHEVAKTSSNLIPPGDDVSKYSQAEIRDRIYGSKLVLVVEQMQLLTIWLVKACLLIMYNRMTMVLPQHKIVIWTAVYVGVSFVVMEVLYLGVWCRPFNQYWAVPPQSSKHGHAIAASQITHNIQSNARPQQTISSPTQSSTSPAMSSSSVYPCPSSSKCVYPRKPNASSSSSSASAPSPLSPQYSTSTTPSSTPLAQNGQSGTSANPTRPSYAPTSP